MRMNGPPGASGPKGNRVLEVFGETVILHGEPKGRGVDASVMEERVPVGVGSPHHRHEREDEISYVLEGTFRIWKGQDVFDVGPGGVVHLPRNEPHAFVNVGATEGRL